MSTGSFRKYAPAPGAEPESRSAPRCSVLVVEDYVDLAETMKWALEDAGHTVTVAFDGRAALEAVETFSPEVVLLELNLPDVTGFEVAARLREHPNAGKASIVAVTAWEELVGRGRARKHGFTTHVLKPFHLCAMLEVVEQAHRVATHSLLAPLAPSEKTA